VSKSMVTGRMGNIIKKYIRQESQASLMDIRKHLKAVLEADEQIPSKSSLHRYLRANGLAVVKSRWAPLTSPEKRAERLAFAKKWLEDGADKLERVIWSDETTVRTHPTSRRNSHWISESTPMKDRPIQSRIHSGGLSQMFWGAISAFGKGPLITIDGTMDAAQYMEVLKRFVKPEYDFARKEFGGNWFFQQDNAPCHKAKPNIAFRPDARMAGLFSRSESY
jgi:hypothetical protein